MSYLKVRTKNNASPQGKPRVYFTCHPDDFEKYFDSICEDIFLTQNCAIYYTESMTAPIPEEYRELDLGRMNMFVVPITFKLLSQPNRAMDSDIAFAKQHNMTILPIMTESGIDSVYSLPKNFGNRHYISKISTDSTEISYQDKLKKYLDSVLLNDETIERIRSAFDTQIFLSYRKKDRVYANKLMQFIHNNPLYRDIAIWFDEFLVPGKDFNISIENAMDASKLFTMVVTPNLINEDNYVKRVEYPNAVKKEMPIIPVEMAKTDLNVLKDKGNFENCPECIDISDSENFYVNFGQPLLNQNIKLSGKSDDIEHNYLIGLAYLDGINVEVNVERGLGLLTLSAEAKYIDAMKKLYDMYSNGDKVQLDYTLALKWAKEIYSYYLGNYGQEHPDTLRSLNNLALAYGEIGDYDKSLEYNKKTYELSCRVLGQEHPNTLRSLNNLAFAYGKIGDYDKFLEYSKKAYELMCRVLGQEYPNTLTSLNNLACAYGKIGDNDKFLEYSKKAYELSCKVLGQEHPNTLTSLNNLAFAYGKVGDYDKELELNKRAYELRCKVLGQDHPDTLQSLNNLAFAYFKMGEVNTALIVFEKLYQIQCRLYGPDAEDTQQTLYAINFIKSKLNP